MFLPIIIDPFAFADMRYRWVFQKYLYYSYINKVPIISQERFSHNISIFDEKFKEKHQYKMLTQDEMDEVDIYYIPEEIFLDLIEKEGSLLAAKLYLLNKRYLPLEKVLESFFEKIAQKHRIEGVLNWAAHFMSVKYLAKKYNYDVITCEYSLRFPNYRSICYLCFDDIYTDFEIRSRYENFVDLKKHIDFDLFSREELLLLFLDNSLVDYINLVNAAPKYQIGIAGCHPLVSTFFAKSAFTDLELVQNIRKNYKEEDILFRMHPGEEPYQATYGFKNQDYHKTPIPFILNCESIAAQGSNILFEAMLWGKPVYSHDVSPFAQFSEKIFSNKKDPYIVPIDFLNFALLCYFVPMEEVCNPEYLAWRRERPNELELMHYHLSIYLKEKNIPKDWIFLSKKKRLKRLKYYRGL